MLRSIAAAGAVVVALQGCGDSEAEDYSIHDYRYQFKFITQYQEEQDLLPHIVQLAKARQAEDSDADLDDVAVGEQDLTFAACTVDYVAQHPIERNVPKDQFNDWFDKAVSKMKEVYLTTPQRVIDQYSIDRANATGFVRLMEGNCFPHRPSA
ncbi:hypothetical protein MHM84_20455 [Halomonas sp. McH1-25]|uniref:hypothetical protein n=1 Tax=unclassified Halomonas TaxID=2609666 RepID=UPI001EF47D75|nr:MULTISPECIES: hypothetical protein [unclassified Halomonas]MCG7602113.1 hypothetical protein [Halomonas sp. McH1-25]MCP1343031.1 hypothetical protein [Halomonas sp. FL8]MCP1362982.1 hypothetical protein [Halomonas sp. BBD45]MCP1364950.1 hypothetical protein [Halomonas sp. BBD48]